MYEVQRPVAALGMLSSESFPIKQLLTCIAMVYADLPCLSIGAASVLLHHPPADTA